MRTIRVSSPTSAALPDVGAGDAVELVVPSVSITRGAPDETRCGAGAGGGAATIWGTGAGATAGAGMVRCTEAETGAGTPTAGFRSSTGGTTTTGSATGGI